MVDRRGKFNGVDALWRASAIQPYPHAFKFFALHCALPSCFQPLLLASDRSKDRPPQLQNFAALQRAAM
jgi:hypothetical protein